MTPPSFNISKATPPSSSTSKVTPPSSNISKATPPSSSTSKVTPPSSNISKVTPPSSNISKVTPPSPKTPPEIPSTRASVSAWWKQKEAEVKKEKQDGKPPPTKEYDLLDSPQPPVQASVLEHYEFSPSYYRDNPEAQQVLKERYEFTSEFGKGSQDSLQDSREASPYEVPLVSQDKPTKPPRRKKGAKIDDPHPPRSSDTWVKPYALTPVAENQPPQRPPPPLLSRKPSRPAPPPPATGKSKVHQSKLKPKEVSPYAVSSVRASPIRGKCISLLSACVFSNNIIR